MISVSNLGIDAGGAVSVNLAVRFKLSSYAVVVKYSLQTESFSYVVQQAPWIEQWVTWGAIGVGIKWFDGVYLNAPFLCLPLPITDIPCMTRYMDLATHDEPLNAADRGLTKNLSLVYDHRIREEVIRILCKHVKYQQTSALRRKQMKANTIKAVVKSRKWSLNSSLM